MGWSGDAKQIVTKITGQRHTDDKLDPTRFKRFLEDLGGKRFADLGAAEQTRMLGKLTERIAWQKFDQEREEYADTTPMNSYDVLKCSQACFHLFEWLVSLLPEGDRPPRQVGPDLRAYRKAEQELRAKGTWPEDPPPGPQPRD